MTKKAKILIIDDEKRFAQMLKVNLEVSGQYDVCIEEQGSKALDTIRSFRPDFILLDVIVPDMPGPEVAAQIQEDEELSKTPVTFLTAVPREKVISEYPWAEKHPFMQKPVSFDGIVEHIKTRLSKEAL